MTADPFTDPAAAGAGIEWKDHKGALLLFTVSGVEPEIKTAYGTSDAVRVDVVVLDGDGAGTEYPDALVFPKVLQSQLRSRVGHKVLGRLGQGVAKSGQSAPWQLEAATDADKAKAKQYLAGQVSSAEPPF